MHFKKVVLSYKAKIVIWKVCFCGGGISAGKFQKKNSCNKDEDDNKLDLDLTPGL